MNSEIEVLNNRINLMQAERNPFAHGAGSVSEEELSMLQFAAALKSLRPGVADPNPGFVSGLRGLVLAEAGKART